MSDKPVAYRYWNEHNKCFFFCDSPKPVDGSIYEPLYTTPQPRKPLTDEEWQMIADTLYCSIKRSQKDVIETALGIKE